MCVCLCVKLCACVFVCVCVRACGYVCIYKPQPKARALLGSYPRGQAEVRHAATAITPNTGLIRSCAGRGAKAPESRLRS